MSLEPGSGSQRHVRFSRTISLRGAVALGASVSVGLGVFALLGQYAQFAAPETVVVPYLVLATIAIPLILTYAERASSITGDSLDLAQAGGVLWMTYGTGWLSLGGYACLISLLGWGVALHLSLLIEHILQVSLNPPYLAVVVIGVLAFNNIFGIRDTWKHRWALILFGMLVLVLLIVGDLLSAPSAVDAHVWLDSTDEVLRVAALMVSGLWGILLIADTRDEVRRPSKTIWRSMALTVLLGSGLGALAAMAAHSSRITSPATLTPLIAQGSAAAPVPSAAAVILYAVAGLFTTFMALNLAITSGLRMVGAMTGEGFFPARLHTAAVSGRFQAPIISLVLFAIAGTLMIALVPVMVLVGLASLAFLWSTVLVHLPDALSRRPKLPDRRRLRLPFHPLFPWIVVATGLLLPFKLERDVLWRGIGWALIGGLFYLAYAGRAGRATRRHEVVVGEEYLDDSDAKAGYCVMVCVRDPKDGPPLIEAGLQLARARKGYLLVLRILTVERHQIAQRRHRLAHEEWEALKDMTGRFDDDDVSITPLVRLAPDPASGILETVREEQVDTLVLGWTGKNLPDEEHPDPVLAPIVRRAPSDVAIIRGQLPSTITRILVPTGGGPNIRLALDLAEDLLEPEEGLITLEYVVAGPLSRESEQEAQASLKSTMDRVEDRTRLDPRMIQARTVKAGIMQEADNYDLLTIGASRDILLERSYFGGLPAEVAAEAPVPVIYCRAAETAASSWLLRTWGAFYDVLPTLSIPRRVQVYEDMRLAAQPSVDFFVMITLAATIAALGLIQGSAAVIIGAMLVAPLMSPILAMAMSVVHGNLRLLRVAAESTVKGIALAVFVASFVTVISPIQSVTAEILARTAPNVLDLIVALASGAAAGYAVSRKEVAAALPGVAISAALLPPLCVVGYGIGTSQLTVSTGALLLFVTNLVAILFAASVTFLALGFHPARAERNELVRGLQIGLASLALIAVVLASITINTVAQQNRQLWIEGEFDEALIARSAQARDVSITPYGNGFLISATVVDFDEPTLTIAELSQIERDISQAVGSPVSIDAAVIPASRFGPDGAKVRSHLEELLEGEMALRSAQVIVSEVEQEGDVFTVRAYVVLSPDHTLSEDDIQDMEKQLLDVTGLTVRIQATILDGHPVGPETPAPVATPTL